MLIDPWSSKQYKNYARLRDEFGIEEFGEDCWKDLPDPHKLLRRGIVFGHRGFERIHEAIKKNDEWVLLTALMPSGKMHLGHKMVIDQAIYYQSLGTDIFIGVADIEAFATRGYSLKDSRKLAINEYIANYIALGLKPCKIYFQSKQRDVKDLSFILAKKANWSKMNAIYGFNGSTNMIHAFVPFIQAGDILHVQLEKYGGIRPTLVPVGIDQDPHIRLSRDLAESHRLFNVTVTKDKRIGIFVKTNENVKKLLDATEKEIEDLFSDLERITKYKAIYLNSATEDDIPLMNELLAKIEPNFGGYGFLSPSSTYHRFMTGLTGGKMSSSEPSSAIFLTDPVKRSIKKIERAKTGGAVSLKEQKESGGEPKKCVIYELFLYHLIEDDSTLSKIYNECINGERLCGECKELACKLMEEFLTNLKEKREKAREKIGEYLS